MNMKNEVMQLLFFCMSLILVIISLKQLSISTDHRVKDTSESEQYGTGFRSSVVETRIFKS